MKIGISGNRFYFWTTVRRVREIIWQDRGRLKCIQRLINLVLFDHQIVPTVCSAYVFVLSPFSIDSYKLTPTLIIRVQFYRFFRTRSFFVHSFNKILYLVIKSQKMCSANIKNKSSKLLKYMCWQNGLWLHQTWFQRCDMLVHIFRKLKPVWSLSSLVSYYNHAFEAEKTQGRAIKVLIKKLQLGCTPLSYNLNNSLPILICYKLYYYSCV